MITNSQILIKTKNVCHSLAVLTPRIHTFAHITSGHRPICWFHKKIIKIKFQYSNQSTHKYSLNGRECTRKEGENNAITDRVIEFKPTALASHSFKFRSFFILRQRCCCTGCKQHFRFD